MLRNIHSFLYNYSFMKIDVYCKYSLQFEKATYQLSNSAIMKLGQNVPAHDSKRVPGFSMAIPYIVLTQFARDNLR